MDDDPDQPCEAHDVLENLMHIALASVWGPAPREAYLLQSHEAETSIATTVRDGDTSGTALRTVTKRLLGPLNILQYQLRTNGMKEPVCYDFEVNSMAPQNAF